MSDKLRQYILDEIEETLLTSSHVKAHEKSPLAFQQVAEEIFDNLIKKGVFKNI